MKETALLIMAAGLGSRFGGLKQMAPLGPSGQIIMDYSVFDAKEAGFDRAVIVIKPENEQDFREVVGKRIEKLIDVTYVYQTLETLPEGLHAPAGRTKPLGTAHAVLMAKPAIHCPFAVINADDFYGKGSYRLLHDRLISENPYSMVGFALGKTLSERGSVSRGICEVKDGNLVSVTEHTALTKDSGFSLDTPVSMNMWGLAPAFFDYLEEEFCAFMKALPLSENPQKNECYLPAVVDSFIKEKGASFAVLKTDENWYGVTYREDAEDVKNAISRMTGLGFYNGL